MNLRSGAGDIVALAARLSPPRLYLETAQGVVQPPPGRGRRYWIVARSLCRFFNVPVPAGASPGRQREIVVLELKRLSPFDETGWHLDLGPDFAAIWLWDRRATRAAAAAIGLDAGRLRVVPEPAMLPPGGDGIRLVQTLEGVEGQHWIGGHLVASRWWRELPDGRAWLSFVRGSGLLPGHDRATPPPRGLSWLARPWTASSRSGAFDLARVDLRVVAAAVAAAVIILYAYQGAQWARIARDTAAVGAEIDQRSRAIEPVLEARRRALDNLSAIRLLHDLDRFPSQLALMARIAEALPGGGTRFTAWSYDQGQLELGIASDQPLDVVKLVRSLEGADHFKSVAAERTGAGNSLRLRLTLDPL